MRKVIGSIPVPCSLHLEASEPPIAPETASSVY